VRRHPTAFSIRSGLQLFAQLMGFVSVNPTPRAEAGQSNAPLHAGHFSRAAVRANAVMDTGIGRRTNVAKWRISRRLGVLGAA